MSAALHRIDPAGFAEQPWAGGGGHTTELAVDADHRPWHWRISIARLEHGATFSVLPGVRRQFAPLDGPVELTFDGAAPHTVLRLQTFAFDGAKTPTCGVDMPGARAFNLMLRADADGQLLLRPLMGSMIVPPRAHTRWLLYVLAGTATASHDGEHLPLATNGAAWIGAHAGRVQIEGGGELALVRITSPEF